MTKESSRKKPSTSLGASGGFGAVKTILNRVLQTAEGLPIWLRFVVVFAVLLVVVVLSGKAVQPSLVPLLYLLFCMGYVGYIGLEFRRGRMSRHAKTVQAPQELSEDDWLDLVIQCLTNCQAACVYLRYFRDPDYGEDKRLQNKRDKVKEIMTAFSRLLLDHEEKFFLVAFRKKSWTDDPQQWLVHKIREIRPDISETEALSMIDRHILVIHEEPEPNSSTIYLVDNRYLFFNRVAGDIGEERKKYHAQDFANSIMPALITQGLTDLFRRHHSES